MTKIMFTPEEFRAVASVGVAASSDDVTPIINTVQVTASGGEVTAIATDRYRIARVIFTPKMDNEEMVDDDINIHAKELTKFWAGIKATAIKSHMPIILTIITEEGEYGDTKKYVLEYDGSRVENFGVKGNYPPVAKLMAGYDEEDCAGVPAVSLNPNFLADMVKMYHPRDENRINMKHVAWQFRFKATDSKKPGPVYITRGGDIGGAKLDYLVQPNLLLR